MNSNQKWWATRIAKKGAKKISEMPERISVMWMQCGYVDRANNEVIFVTWWKKEKFPITKKVCIRYLNTWELKTVVIFKPTFYYPLVLASIISQAFHSAEKLADRFDTQRQVAYYIYIFFMFTYYQAYHKFHLKFLGEINNIEVIRMTFGGFSPLSLLTAQIDSRFNKTNGFCRALATNIHLIWYVTW